MGFRLGYFSTSVCSSLSCGSYKTSRTNLALAEIVVSLDLQDVARLAAHLALGTIEPPAARAVQQRVLDLQLLAVGGFTGVVDTARWETRSGILI